VPKSTVKLSNRAPETQVVLRKIKGWGINWGVTIVFALFMVMLFATFQFRYPRTAPIQVKIESPSVVQVIPNTADFEMGAGTLELAGANYQLVPDAVRGEQGYFRTEAALPLQANNAAPLEATFTQEVNILSIIFKGLY